MCMQKRITHLLKKVVAILSLNEETHYMVSRNITYKIFMIKYRKYFTPRKQWFYGKLQINLHTNIYYGKNYPSMHAK